MSMTETDALSALASDEPGFAPSPPPATPDVTPVSSDQPGTTPTDSFSSVDLNALPPELQEVYKSMQADYTRKTQEAAPWRTTFSDIEGADPKAIREAYEFYNNLNSDPDYAQQIYGQLGEALKPYMEASTTEVDDVEFDNPLEAQVNKLSQQLEAMQAQQQYNAGAAELQRQEMAVRNANPSWKDDDFTTVYELALAHNGNLVKASEQYNSLRTRIVADYMNTKAAVGTNTSPVGAGANGIEVQEAPRNTKEAHVQAYEYLKNVLGAQG
jgi:phage gpG-like protein